MLHWSERVDGPGRTLGRRDQINLRPPIVECRAMEVPRNMNRPILVAYTEANDVMAVVLNLGVVGENDGLPLAVGQGAARELDLSLTQYPVDIHCTILPA